MGVTCCFDCWFRIDHQVLILYRISLSFKFQMSPVLLLQPDVVMVIPIGWVFVVPRLQYHPSECGYECPLGFECDVVGLEDLENSKCKFCCLIMFDVVLVQIFFVSRTWQKAGAAPLDMAHFAISFKNESINSWKCIIMEIEGCLPQYIPILPPEIVGLIQRQLSTTIIRLIQGLFPEGGTFRKSCCCACINISQWIVGALALCIRKNVNTWNDLIFWNISDL